MNDDEPPEVLIDCDAGRCMGCATLCCRLIVRLDPETCVLTPEGLRKNCLDKRPEDGLCVQIDQATYRCNVWEERPKTCRGYDCNNDPLLQIVLRDGFRDLRTLVTSEDVPREDWQRIPAM